MRNLRLIFIFFVVCKELTWLQMLVVKDLGPESKNSYFGSNPCFTDFIAFDKEIN